MGQTFLIATVLTLYTTLTCATNTSIHSLFSQIEERSQPIYNCNTWSSGIPWKLPSPINCPIVSTSKPSKVIELTLWFSDITMDLVDGFDCYQIVSSYETFVNFFGTQYITRSKTKKAVTEMECRNMVKKRKSKGNQDLIEVDSGIFATNNALSEEYNYLSTTTDEVTNYYFIETKISALDSHNTILTTAKVTEQCTLYQGSCPTENGILIWQRSEVKLCRLKQGPTSTCLMTENTISCQALELSISNFRTVFKCGLPIGVSIQGMMFTQSNHSIDKSIALTDHMQRTVRRRVPTKRDVYDQVHHGGSYLNPSFMSAAEVNSKIQYLYDIVRQNQQSAIQLIHSETCNSYQSHLELLKMLAASGQVNEVIRTFLKSPAYRATLNGDIIEVFKCAEIYTYKLLERDTCTLEWPIQYISGSQNHSGYLSGVSHEISSSPTELPCPPPNFYFNYENQTFSLGAKSVLESVPVLPSQFVNSEPDSLPDLAFQLSGAFTVDEISGKRTLIDLFKETNRRSRIDEVIKTRATGQKLSPSQQNTITVLRDSLIAPFESILQWVILGIALLIAIYIIIKITTCLFRKAANHTV